LENNLFGLVVLVSTENYKKQASLESILQKTSQSNGNFTNDNGSLKTGEIKQNICNKINSEIMEHVNKYTVRNGRMKSEQDITNSP
jgi:hypothetical protein